MTIQLIKYFFAILGFFALIRMFTYSIVKGIKNAKEGKTIWSNFL